MIKNLVTKHLSKAFDNSLADAVSEFIGRRKGDGKVYDVESGDYIDNDDVIYTGRGTFSSYNDSEIQSSQIDISDIKLLCLQSEVTSKPEIDDIITQDGKDRTVLRVSQDPAGATWIVQLRGLNVG